MKRYPLTPTASKLVPRIGFAIIASPSRRRLRSLAHVSRNVCLLPFVLLLFSQIAPSPVQARDAGLSAARAENDGGYGSPLLMVTFEQEPAATVTYQLRAARATGPNRLILEAETVPGNVPFEIDVSAAPNGDYILYLYASGHVRKWIRLTVENGRYRFSSALPRRNDTYRATLWRPRYLVMSYYVTDADEPNFEGVDVEYYRVAVSHFARPPVLSWDFIAWQGSTDRRFGPAPFLSRHRFYQGWGQVEIGGRNEFEAMTRFDTITDWSGTAIRGTANSAYLIKLRGNSSIHNRYVKLLVEGTYDVPPPGVDVYDDPSPHPLEASFPSRESRPPDRPVPPAVTQADPVLNVQVFLQLVGTVDGPSFAAWQAAQFAGETDPNLIGPTASPAGDGIANLLKYAFGIDAMTPAVTGDFTKTEMVDGHLRLTYRERRDSDLIYTPEMSSDLEPSGWSAEGVREIPGGRIRYDDDFDQVTVSAVPPEGSDSVFLRVTVRQGP